MAVRTGSAERDSLAAQLQTATATIESLKARISALDQQLKDREQAYETVRSRLMERDKLPGTLKIWPGVAEELVGTKAYFVRGGYFKDVDVALFTHVDSELGVSWGDRAGTGLVSVEYTFSGQSAHSAGVPWRCTLSA